MGFLCGEGGVRYLGTCAVYGTQARSAARAQVCVLKKALLRAEDVYDLSEFTPHASSYRFKLSGVKLTIMLNKPE